MGISVGADPTKLDVAVSTRAAAATALSNATWTDTRAGYLDHLKTPRYEVMYIPFGKVADTITTSGADYLSVTNTVTIPSGKTIDHVVLRICLVGYNNYNGRNTLSSGAGFYVGATKVLNLNSDGTSSGLQLESQYDPIFAVYECDVTSQITGSGSYTIKFNGYAAGASLCLSAMYTLIITMHES